ncbi:MAG: 4-alpha-glucanotransferase, partial [Sphingobacteriales bacterium]
PLFSLPSRYGIGDMGSEARAFITKLFQGGQRLWQILPLNPVLEANACSPYACSSAFAGDPMYIDLEALRDEGLLEAFDLLSIEVMATRKVHYGTVRANKAALLDKSWVAFQQRDDVAAKAAFERFCVAEAHWLEDYAAYVVLKQMHADQSWTEWPEELRHRESAALAAFKVQERTALDQQRWLQFVFFQQWDKLKTFAGANNISFVGDIPFYMSQDSADVWAKPELFAMNEDSSLQWVAGVPPDYFSATGQLWGMPTYRWAVHQQQGYSWWIERLQQNVRLFDIVRLDHFRAFYDYWEIPGDAETAIDGTWQDGPRDDLFSEIKKHFPNMPFIAEDLGEIHKGVFAFKDTWKLPGMRVLQFGFSTYDPSLRDLPHNCTASSVVYTGTHDNDTTAGWFAALDDAARNALQAYAGTVINEDNVADIMIKMAYGTVADTLIIPIQDLLNL